MRFLENIFLFFMPLLGILALALIYGFFKLLIMIFKHPLYSRIAGLIVAIADFVVSLLLSSMVDQSTGDVMFAAFPLALLHTISYIFALGADDEAFDTYWDGTYSFFVSNDRSYLRKNLHGGFWSQFCGSCIIGFIVSLLALGSMTFLLWLIPIGLAILNIVLIYKVVSY